MEEQTERAYTSKEMSLTLDISTSNLRKWCLSLEEQGYTFTRNEQNKRLFLERDLVTLRHFKDFVQDKGFTLSNASVVIVSRFNKERSSTLTPTVTGLNEERTSVIKQEELDKLLNYIDKQEQFNKQLMERLVEQQKYIDNRLNKHDEQLTQALRQSIETQKMISAAKEEEKKGFWAKLFNRN